MGTARTGRNIGAVGQYLRRPRLVAFSVVARTIIWHRQVITDMRFQ
jgi:hypothetical protein